MKSTLFIALIYLLNEILTSSIILCHVSLTAHTACYLTHEGSSTQLDNARLWQ